MKIRVYYEDTDTNGIVYHTVYMQYCERARSELFFNKGLSPIDTNANNTFFVVKSINANFLGSAKLGDVVEVKTTNKTFKRSFVILLQEIFLNDTCIFTMEVTLVYIANGKPIRIPHEMLQVLTIT